jgi:hypothetical protein
MEGESAGVALGQAKGPSRSPMRPKHALSFGYGEAYKVGGVVWCGVVAQRAQAGRDA